MTIELARARTPWLKQARSHAGGASPQAPSPRPPSAPPRFRFGTGAFCLVMPRGLVGFADDARPAHPSAGKE